MFTSRHFFSTLLAAAVCAASAASATTTSPIVLTGSTTTTVNVIEEDFNLLNDMTWFTFEAVAGTNITLTATSDSDPCIELYVGDVTGLDFGALNGNCTAGNAGGLLPVLAIDDDGGPGLNSFLSVLAPSTGVFSFFVSDLFTNDYPTEVSATFTSPSAVPLPAGLPLLLAGLGALGLMRRRKPA